MIGNKYEIQDFLQSKTDQEVFEIKEVKSKDLLTRSQQKYYFGVVVATIGNFHGYTPVETHELIKQTFKLETTTGLGKDEFKAMIDIIRDLWITKYDLYIALPSDIEGDKSLYFTLGF